MRLIDRIRIEAERQYWPPYLFELVLRKVEEQGINLNCERSHSPCHE